MTIATITEQSLAALAEGYAVAPPWRVRFTPHSRWARRVHVAADHEVWLLAWLPGQGTELHDHGGAQRPSPGAFAVVCGQLTEHTVVPGETPSLDRREFAAGAPARTVGDRAVHALTNTGDVPAVSVHVYAPRLDVMRRYLFDESGLWLASMKRAGADWLEDPAADLSYCAAPLLRL
ncbi:MAG: cysteine dioxygenase, partial [Stackebrandtia sp.]